MLALHSCNKSFPTHFTNTSNNLLDLYFVNDLSKCLLYDQISGPIFSKHDLIFLTYDFQFRKAPLKPVFYRDFKNINNTELEWAIHTVNWNVLYTMVSVHD